MLNLFCNVKLFCLNLKSVLYYDDNVCKKKIKLLWVSVKETFYVEDGIKRKL